MSNRCPTHSVQSLSKLCPSCVQAGCSKFLLACFPYSVTQSCPILPKHCPSCVLAPPFLSKLATKQCREFKFLLLSGVCESHNSGIQSLVATFGGLRVPQIRPLVTSHLVQSLSKRCPSCDQAPSFLTKRLPSAVQAVTKPPSFLTKLCRMQCWEYMLLYSSGI